MNIKPLIHSTLLATFAAPMLFSATVGYWRFEDSPGFYQDSSGNSLTLSPVPNIAEGPIETTIPASGPGSSFLKDIPVESVSSNDQMAFFGSTQLRNFTAADNALYDSPSFTIESFAHQVERGEHQYIASHYESDTGDRSWAFGVFSNGTLFAILSSTAQSGNSATVYNSSVSVSLGTDYYLGASFDNTTGDLTFYAQDLTNGGMLISEINSTGINLHTGSGSDFQIATYNNSASDRRWEGYLDEIRLSDTALNSNELLVVPEPSSIFLLLGSISLLILVSRRR